MILKSKRANPKPCKGQSKARGFGGCGNSIQIHRYGLCDDCFSKWLTGTEAGSQVVAKAYQKSVTETKAEKRKAKTEAKRQLLSVDAYRAKVLQPVINEIARLIDEGLPCIASGVTAGKFSGGHFTAVGANRSIALNLHNIHKQAYHSNGPKGGQPIEYLQGIRERYGNDYAEWVLSMRQIKVQKWKKFELEKAFKAAKLHRINLKAIPSEERSKWTPEQRIQQRNEANEAIGLYVDFQKYE